MPDRRKVLIQLGAIGIAGTGTTMIAINGAQACGPICSALSRGAITIAVRVIDAAANEIAEVLIEIINDWSENIQRTLKCRWQFPGKDKPGSAQSIWINVPPGKTRTYTIRSQGRPQSGGEALMFLILDDYTEEFVFDVEGDEPIPPMEIHE